MGNGTCNVSHRASEGSIEDQKLLASEDEAGRNVQSSGYTVGNRND
jgi:hypothetical protein